MGVGSKRLPRQDTSGQFSRRGKVDNAYCPQPVVPCAKLQCDAPACIVIQLDPAPTCCLVTPPPVLYAQTRPPLMQMPYFRTPAHPLQQSPGLVVSLKPASEICSD